MWQADGFSFRRKEVSSPHSLSSTNLDRESAKEVRRSLAPTSGAPTLNREGAPCVPKDPPGPRASPRTPNSGVSPDPRGLWRIRPPRLPCRLGLARNGWLKSRPALGTCPCGTSLQGEPLARLACGLRPAELSEGLPPCRDSHGQLPLRERSSWPTTLVARPT